jgi:hypothetical protein
VGDVIVIVFFDEVVDLIIGLGVVWGMILFESQPYLVLSQKSNITYLPQL